MILMLAEPEVLVEIDLTMKTLPLSAVAEMVGRVRSTAVEPLGLTRVSSLEISPEAPTSHRCRAPR